MAERSTCRTLNSSIRSEDLLSDMELLPASVPATPSQQVPRAQSASPFASRVTTQLYTSLHQSWQAEAQARSHLEAQHSLLQARETEAPEVDLDTLAEELSHRLSTSVEASAHKKGSAIESRHISEMENVRCHLQSMLRSSREAAHGDGLAAQIFERKDDDSFESDSTAALLNARPLQEISPPGSAAGFEELFPRYTSLRLGPAREPSAYTDVHLLKDTLDKEQARRKHCERHIQALQNRLLELQQQLAVAVSADKKKDGMIEQLDKTLAKVVEGWNRHEAERTETLRRLQAEKEAAVQMLGRHKEVGLRGKKMQEAEGRLEEATSALSREQQAVSLYCKEKERLEEEKATLSRSLEAEGQRARSLEADWDLERRQHEALRATLEEQQRSWAQRERQVEQQVQALQEESRAQLDKEKAAVQREAQKAVDAQRVLASVQAEVQGLESELEALRQERDSLKMEMSLVKARYEAQKVKLESELKVVLEQQVTERLAEVHEESLHQMTAMREQHRKQLLDLAAANEKELAGQLVQFKTVDLGRAMSGTRQLIGNFTTGDRVFPQTLEALPQNWSAFQLSESLQKDQKRESPRAPLQETRGRGPQEGRVPPSRVLLQSGPLSTARLCRGPSEGPESVAGQHVTSPFLPLCSSHGALSPEFSHIPQLQLLSQPCRTSSSFLNHRWTRQGANGQLLEQNASENSAQKQEGLSGENPPHHVGQTQLGSSQSYHEPSTALWDPGRASVSAIRIQPASSAAVHKTKVPLSKAGVTCTGLEVSEAQKRNPAHEVGILSHKQVAEVSRLFKQYQAKGKPMPSTEELYGYLRSSEMKGDGNVHTRRSFDARLTEAVRKEMAPTRRTGLSRERPHAASKTGKKLSGVPNSNVRNSKGGSVWR
uniref:Uncharacterized protein n=1 Tax=Sphaerodactylus townsendi TaxID=933632 RepID=A0ACB8EXE5_9SAUR